MVCVWGGGGGGAGGGGAYTCCTLWSGNYGHAHGTLTY